MNLQQHLEPIKNKDGTLLLAFGGKYTITVGMDKGGLHRMSPQFYPDKEVYDFHLVLPHRVASGAAASYDELVEEIRKDVLEDPAPTFEITTYPPAWKPSDLPFRTYNEMIPNPVSREKLVEFQKDISAIFPKIIFEIKEAEHEF